MTMSRSGRMWVSFRKMRLWVFCLIEGAFISFCVAIPAAPLPADTGGNVPLKLKVVCPYELEGRAERSIYRPNVIGTFSPYSDASYPVRALVAVENASSDPVEDLVLTVRLGDHLRLQRPVSGKEWEWLDEKGLKYQLKSIKPSERREFAFYMERPNHRQVPEGEAETDIIVQAEYSGPNGRGLLTFAQPLTISNPSQRLGPLALFMICFLLLAVLVYVSRRFDLFSRFSTTELVSVALFTAFLVLSSFVTHFMRSIGMPSLVLHVVWHAYFWVVLIIAVRVMAKPGALTIMFFAQNIASSLLLYGLSLVTLITYTLSASLALEAWFALSGYARSARSAVGGALVYLAFPTAFYWFFTAPIIYHYYFALWYIEWWLTVDFVLFTLSAYLGFRLSSRIISVIR